MTLKFTAALAAAALAAPAMAFSGAQAQDISVAAVRVGADAGDVAATAAFYAEAFGLTEVNRFGGEEPAEIIMNFGDTPEAASANSGAQVVVMARPADAPEDTLPHLIFSVSDAQAVADNAVAAGATIQQAPSEFGDSGVVVAFLVDPEGNRIELLQFPTGAP